MKKFGFLVMALLLCMPFAANAGFMGTGDMNLYASAPSGNGYYWDYDAWVYSSSFGYTTDDWVEVFCVSPQYMANPEHVSFYSIDKDTSADLKMAAWIADNWITWGTDDTTKGEAQKAVWQIMNVFQFVGSDGDDWEIYNAALKHGDYVTNSWLFADSSYNQDFLTPYTAVPEPAILLLLGVGLVGLAGMKRKFRK